MSAVFIYLDDKVGLDFAESVRRIGACFCHRFNLIHCIPSTPGKPPTRGCNITTLVTFLGDVWSCAIIICFNIHLVSHLNVHQALAPDPRSSLNVQVDAPLGGRARSVLGEIVQLGCYAIGNFPLLWLSILHWGCKLLDTWRARQRLRGETRALCDGNLSLLWYHV